MQAVSYAHALHQAARNADRVRQEELFQNLLHILKTKGHQRLLPQILHEYERLMAHVQEQSKGVLEVTHQKDVRHLTKEIERACQKLHLTAANLELKVNDQLVGGFLLRKSGTLFDASYRRQLIELYRRLITV